MAGNPIKKGANTTDEGTKHTLIRCAVRSPYGTHFRSSSSMRRAISQ